ncbi:MAG: alpha/beta hydrolase [Candidatus Eisenbacteria bacterium]|uniref:Alpha/beta hydrolase n=1 Tax=Eiseniibacteriota bacterium TaxID=2212470 RepID=A0A937XCS0_UNCEI|nr:alpha/beta hydrolase [Candidatus Eisenbacteria bacterium]
MGPCPRHGAAPYRVAVVHGGPGAPGEMAPLARALARDRGILEPHQSERSLEGQVRELRDQLERWATPPVTLIGFSWGAWLAWILAARHEPLIGKLILVGSGSFEERYAEGMLEARLARLQPAERAEVERLRRRLEDPARQGHDETFARFGELLSRADSYDPLPGEDDEVLAPEAGVFRGVWPQAAEWRRSGRLLELAERIRCPVVAIHGEHDPHPAAGVREPLAAVLEEFRFVLLPRCGHKPWIERHARAAFFDALAGELRDA